MLRIKPRTQNRTSSDEEFEIRPDQKLCRRCGNVVPRELQRCSFCKNAPWLWHPNTRLFLITLLIGLFLFVLFPLLSSQDTPYRVPITQDDPAH